MIENSGTIGSEAAIRPIWEALKEETKLENECAFFEMLRRVVERNFTKVHDEAHTNTECIAHEPLL